MKCKKGTVSKIYFVKTSDLVFDNDTVVRLKRKYGKNRREVIVLDADKK